MPAVDPFTRRIGKNLVRFSVASHDPEALEAVVVDGPDYPYAVTSSIRVFYMPGEQGDAPEISVSEHMKLFIEGLEETAEQQGGRLHVCDDESDEDEYAGLYDDEDA